MNSELAQGTFSLSIKSGSYKEANEAGDQLAKQLTTSNYSSNHPVYRKASQNQKYIVSSSSSSRTRGLNDLVNRLAKK